MMKRLIEALESGEDIGHYGRLVFAVVARHFMSNEELVEQLSKCPGFSGEQALSLVDQVSQRDYNPPRREKILQWQQEQDFKICLSSGDPDACNLYKDLKFPHDVYEKIEDYHLARSTVGEHESTSRKNSYKAVPQAAAACLRNQQ
jgi:DNA primase large subunit